jgi:hypothetical protein
VRRAGWSEAAAVRRTVQLRADHLDGWLPSPALGLPVLPHGRPAATHVVRGMRTLLLPSLESAIRVDMLLGRTGPANRDLSSSWRRRLRGVDTRLRARSPWRPIGEP